MDLHCPVSPHSGGVGQADLTQNQDNEYNDDHFGLSEMLDMEDDKQDAKAILRHLFE